MVQAITTYACDVCRKVHPTALDASACEERPVTHLPHEPGDYVGVGTHGWWDSFQDWVLTMPVQADPRPTSQGRKEMHEPAHTRKGEWRRPDPMESLSTAVGANWWLPIWRTVGLVPDPRDGHRLLTVLWTPQHANGSREKLVWTSEGHHPGLPLPVALHPRVSDKQLDRFMALRAELEADPVAFARRVPLL